MYSEFCDIYSPKVEKSSIQIRLYDDETGHVAYKRLTENEAEKVFELLNMNLDERCNEF